MTLQHNAQLAQLETIVSEQNCVVLLHVEYFMCLYGAWGMDCRVGEREGGEGGRRQ